MKNRQALTSEEQLWKSNYVLRLLSIGWYGWAAQMHTDTLYRAKKFQDRYREHKARVMEQYGIYHVVSRDDIGNQDEG